ncbi:MAG: hypothetical protein AB7K09_15680 [Planctomycetota bacterium]
MDSSTAGAISALTKSKGFAQRLKHYVDQGDELIAQNETDIFIVDEARVLAEIILMNYRPRWHAFWDRQTLTAATGDQQFFTAAQTAATLHARNMEAAGQLPRDQIFFAKRLSAVLDPTATQADKRIIINDYVLEFKLHTKPIVQRKLRGLQSGEGLDGELNNGVADARAKFELPGFVRVPAQQNIELLVHRLNNAIAGTPWLEIELDGILGQRK